jgi:prophage regulatory protein
VSQLDDNPAAMPCIQRLPAVLKRIGVSRSTLYDLVRKGEFVRPIKLSPRAVGWLSDDVTAYLLQRRSAAYGTES